jgi:hypothetical protein
LLDVNSPLARPPSFWSVPGIPVTGTVGFSVDGNPITSCEAATLDVTGLAECTTSGIVAGSHTISAKYSGDAEYNSSIGTMAAPQVVNVAAPISAPDTVCSGSTDNTASVPDNGPGALYDWQISNGTITAGSGTDVVTFSAGASGDVGLSVTVESFGDLASDSRGNQVTFGHQWQ